MAVFLTDGWQLIAAGFAINEMQELHCGPARRDPSMMQFYAFVDLSPSRNPVQALTGAMPFASIVYFSECDTWQAPHPFGMASFPISLGRNLIKMLSCSHQQYTGSNSHLMQS